MIRAESIPLEGDMGPGTAARHPGGSPTRWARIERWRAEKKAPARMTLYRCFEQIPRHPGAESPYGPTRAASEGSAHFFLAFLAAFFADFLAAFLAFFAISVLLKKRLERNKNTQR